MLVARIIFGGMATALAVNLAYGAGPVLWRLTGEPVGLARPAAAPSRTPTGPSATRDLSVIAQAKPFGAIDAPVAKAAVPSAEPVSGLILKGVVLSDRPELRRAFILAPGGEVKRYRIGDMPIQGLEIMEIREDRVILSSGDKLLELRFPKAGPTGGGTPQLAAGAPLQPVLPSPGASTDPTRRAAAPEVSTDVDQVIARYRAAILYNPTSVMARLGIEASDKGYVVKAKTAPGVLRAGFRPGDVVVKVNGSNVGNVDSDMDLIDQIISSGNANVEVLRDGETVTMSFPLQ